jgi:hypothetical protein
MYTEYQGTEIAKRRQFETLLARGLSGRFFGCPLTPTLHTVWSVPTAMLVPFSVLGREFSYTAKASVCFGKAGEPPVQRRCFVVKKPELFDRFLTTSLLGSVLVVALSDNFALNHRTMDTVNRTCI